MGRPGAGAEVPVLERADGGGGSSASSSTNSSGRFCLPVADATFLGRRAGRSAAEQEDSPP